MRKGSVKNRCIIVQTRNRGVLMFVLQWIVITAITMINLRISMNLRMLKDHIERHEEKEGVQIMTTDLMVRLIKEMEKEERDFCQTKSHA